MADIEALLAPVPGDQPGGPDLRYARDADDLALDVELAKDEDVEKGVREAEPTDWHAVARLCEALLGKSKNLRYAAQWARAQAALAGAAGVRDGLVLCHRLAEGLWASGLHPELDADDPDRPWFDRFKAAEVLDFAPRQLRQAELAFARGVGTGKFTYRDLEILAGLIKPADGFQVAANQFHAALQADPDRIRTARAALDEAVAATDALSERMVQLAEAPPDKAPALDRLRTHLRKLSVALGEQMAAAGLGGTPAPDGDGSRETEETPMDASGAAPRPAAAAAVQGPVGDRAGVRRALAAVCQYYESAEPTSPVLEVLRYADRYVDLGYRQLYPLVQVDDDELKLKMPADGDSDD